MKYFIGKAMEMKMNHGLHRLAALMLACLGMLLGGVANAATVTATTDAFRLSIKHDGIRQSAGDETLTYSSLWDGGDGATITIAQDGVVLVEGLTGEGERAWSVTRNGTYVLTHTTYTNGVAGKAETAMFIVTGKDIPFPAADVTVSNYSNKYDGVAHGIGVMVASGIENVALKYAVGDGTPTLSWVTEPPALTDVGSMTVWCEIAAPGYITQTNSATVTITKRAVTLTSGDASKVYDGFPALCGDILITGDGFAAGEGATFNVTGSQTSVGTSENTFTYTLDDGTKADNYDITTVTGTLTVTKATVGSGGGGGDEPGGGEVPTGGESKFDMTLMYDGAGHTIDTNALFAAFGASMIGDFSCVYAQGQSPALQWQAEVPVYTNVGEYVVQYKVTNPNYNDFTHAAKVTITNRPVTVVVTGHSATYTYDTTEKGISGYEATTEDALYDIVAYTAFSGVAYAARTDVGTTAMGLSASDFSNNNANFTVTYAVTDGGLTINPRVIGDNPANWDIRLGKSEMYDGTEKTAPIIQVCYVKPDSNLDNIPYALSGNTATNAGNYVVSITGTGNYAGTIEKDWAIMPRNVTLTSGSANWTYDGAPHSQTAISVTGDGFVAGEGASYSGFPVATHVADAATPIANAFSYTLNAGTKVGNYAITTANGTVRMTPRAIILTSPTKSRQYDGTALSFEIGEISKGGDGYASGEAFTLGSFASITEAGRVDATFTVADGTALVSDYAIIKVLGTLMVTKNATEITVTAKSASWTYDGQPHALHEYEATNLGVLQAGDALEVTFDDKSVVLAPIDGPEHNGVVANVITSVRVMRGDVDVSSNYTLAPYNGTLTVTRRPVTLTSKSNSKAYDGTALTAHEVEVGGNGFVGEDGANYSFTGSQTDKGTSKNTFTYTLKGGTNAAFYDITKVEGDLEVTAADISTGSDGDWQIVFGPALTYTGLEQIQTLASVTYKGLPLDYSVTGNAQTDAWTYQMTLTGQGNFTGEHAVEWSIAPKALTLTAGSGSRVYDGTAFTVGAVTASGFVAGEGAECTCDGSQKDVGSSENAVGTISWNANTKASNYAVTKVAGSLTVTPRPMTLTAANLSKPYDGTPLALTAADIAASGIVAGESFSYSDFASRTEAGQTPATFSYAAGPGTSLANYAVTVTAGRMITITKSATAISVTAASESWVYDAEAHSNRTWTATNLSTLQAGDELEVTFDEASVVTTPQDGPAHDGVVANVINGVRVIRNGADDVTANYSVEWFPGTLAVTKRPVTVTVTGHTATFTYDGEEKTVTGYDATTADALYDIAADMAFSGVATTNRIDAGKSDMGLKASDFTNNDDCFDVTYTVTDGWVKIDPLDIAAAGDEFAIVLGANPMYNGTVQTIPLDSVTCGGLPVTYTLAGENATHAGTYTLTVKANGNFTGERSTTWQVLKRAVTLTSGSASKVYDGLPLANGSVVVGGDGFIGLEGATFEVTGSQTGAGTSKNTFAYTLKAGTLAGDYAITKVEGDLVVTKAVYPGQELGGVGIRWSVAADAATWMYDGLVHGVTLTGVPSGVTPHISGNTATDAGEYTASVTLDYDAANYEPPVAPVPLAWTITKRPISLQTVNAEKPYDGFPLSVDVANITPGLSGYAVGECFDYYDLASITEVGEIAATFSYRDSATAKVANYAVTVIGDAMLKVTVGGDQISVTAKDGTWAYDGEAHRLAEWTIVNADKLLDGHEFQIKVSDASVITTPCDGDTSDGIVSNTFEYVRIVDTASGADKTRNYNLFVYEGKLQVTNACIGVEMLDGIERIEKIYDGVATGAVVTAVLLQPAAVRYCGGRGATALPDGEWANEPPQFTDAGDYTVWYEITADYYDAYTGRVDIAIAKRPVTLTSPTKAKTYDGAVLTFTAAEVTATFNGDDAALGDCALPDGESLAFSNFASITDAGRVDATFDYAAGANTDLGNYEVSVVNGTLTVNASADEITVTAKSGSWPYDAQSHVLHECEVVNGDVLQQGDELVVEYDAASVVTTPDDGDVENRIASVRVMRGGANGEDVTHNYSIAVYPGTIKVVNANVTFGAIDPAAFSTQATYDGAGHTIAVTAPILLTTPVTVAYSATGAEPWNGNPMAVAATNAGTHTIRYRISAQYYNDYFGEATVTISPRMVTLLSASAAKVFDGTPLRKDEVSVKDGSLGFVDGEGVDATCNNAQTGVGKIENGFTYEFKTGTLSDNYTIIPEFGWLEVTPGTLSINVEQSNYTGVYDGSPHGVTPVFSGTGLNPNACEVTYALVDGDESAYVTESPTFIDAGTNTVYVKIKAQNFAVVYTEMTVTVTKRTAMLTSVDGNWVYDGLAHSNAMVIATGFVAGEGVEANVFATIIDVGATPNAFDYDFVDGTLAANYDVNCVTGMLHVTKASAGGDPGGGEPGSGIILDGGESKFDIAVGYDGSGHTINTNALVVAFNAAMIGGATVEYAVDDGTGVSGGSGEPVMPWGAVPVYTNAGIYYVWYKVTNLNYNDFLHVAKLVIEPRDIVNTTIVSIPDIVYEGIAAEPVPVVYDGEPSIITPADYSVSYSGNNTPGTATVTLTGQGNYKGTKSASFNLVSPSNKVILDALGGTVDGKSVITQECTTAYGILPVATRENYTFDGWFLGVTNGAPQAVPGGTLLEGNNHVLFARWSVDTSVMPEGTNIFSYVVIDANTARITGLVNPRQTLSHMVLPDTIGGLAVTEIAVGAFANLKNGLAEVTFSTFCTNINDKAFLSIPTLTTVNFADAREWDAPSMEALVRIGEYAFAGTEIVSLTLPESIGFIGDYTFANCKNLASVTLLGHPLVGIRPFRRSGNMSAGGVVLHLDPVLAEDTDYMAAISAQMDGNVDVRTDAVITKIAMSAMSVSAKKTQILVSVDKAAAWGMVDLSSVKVRYRAKLSDSPETLVPSAVTDNGDGTLTVEVFAPKGSSGFFQTIIEK